MHDSVEVRPAPGGIPGALTSLEVEGIASEAHAISARASASITLASGEGSMPLVRVGLGPRVSAAMRRGKCTTGREREGSDAGEEQGHASGSHIGLTRSEDLGLLVDEIVDLHLAGCDRDSGLVAFVERKPVGALDGSAHVAAVGAPTTTVI